LKEKYLILPDSSFREDYCYCDDKKNFDQVSVEWDQIIDAIESRLVNFSGDYEFIEIPFCAFESIGGRELISPYKNTINNCFPQLLERKFRGTEEEAAKFIDQHFMNSFNNLFNLFCSNLSIDRIINKIGNKLKEKKLHPHVESLRTYLLNFKEDLIEYGINSHIFQQLCRDLAWDALTKRTRWLAKYEHSTDSTPEESYVKFDEAYVTTRLIAHHNNNTKNNAHLAGSALFIKISKLQRRDSGYLKEDNENLTSYGEHELVDPMLTEYPFIGFYNCETKRREKVIVITCDTGIKNKTKIYANTREKIDADLERCGLNKQPFFPGYIIVIDPKAHKIREFIDIAEEFFKQI